PGRPDLYEYLRRGLDTLWCSVSLDPRRWLLGRDSDRALGTPRASPEFPEASSPLSPSAAAGTAKAPGSGHGPSISSSTRLRPFHPAPPAWKVPTSKTTSESCASLADAEVPDGSEAWRDLLVERAMR